MAGWPRPALVQGEVRMRPEEQWELVRGARASRIESAGMGAVRIALLFGSAAVAFALLAVPFLDARTRPQVSRAGLDMVSTGSIDRGSYTIRRSVLQSSPSAICVIRNDGVRRGDC